MLEREVDQAAYPPDCDLTDPSVQASKVLESGSATTP